ncbi:MAG: sigma factor-like helix-turn-helix DNA-binding protein [Candidatus Brocadiia bacterium]
MAEVLRILPHAQREVVLMRLVDDMKLKEIVAALDIPTGTAKPRLYNALKTLREDERTRNYFQE